MNILKQTAFSLVLLMAPSSLMAAQSVLEWDCGTDGYRVGMNENVSSNSTIAVSIGCHIHTRKQPQQGRLTRTGSTDNRGGCTRYNLQINAVQYGEIAISGGNRF